MSWYLHTVKYKPATGMPTVNAMPWNMATMPKASVRLSKPNRWTRMMGRRDVHVPETKPKLKPKPNFTQYASQSQVLTTHGKI